jgi:hypothetical protein
MQNIDAELQDLLDRARELKKDCVKIIGAKGFIKNIEEVEYDHIKNSLNTLESGINCILQVEKYKPLGKKNDSG